MNRFLIILVITLVSYSGCRIFEESDPVGPLEVTAYSEIKISSPVEGMIISKGSTMAIRWSGIKIRKVNIELLKKQQYYLQVIAKEYTNDGAYNWRVPEDTPASTYYQIKISNYENPEEYVYSDVFRIR
jgi:hypothetical protein